MNGRRWAGSAVLVAVGCSSGRAPPPAVTSALPAGLAARAGGELISAASVSRIAVAQGLAARAAVGLAVSDALFAQGARATLPAASTRSIERAAAARSLLEQLGGDASRAGAPTEAELTEVTRERWVELDRPAAARTTHALVMNDKPERDAQARALAEKLAAALRGATSGEELIRLAQAFPAEGFKIHSETLPFVTADGRTFQRRDAGFAATSAAFDLGFARAANALARQGELSPVVKTGFGYHVIRLEELEPASTVPKSDLPTLLGAEVLRRRADRARRELLEKLHRATQVQLERAVDELTAQVQAAP
jgi:hypothetical protein